MGNETKTSSGDISFYFWSTVLIIVSYAMTIEGLSKPKIDLSNIQTVIEFLKEAFVFITPCGLDALVLLTSPQSKSSLNDNVEIVITLISLCFSGYLLIVILLKKGILPLWIIQLILLGYPIRFVANFAFSVYEALACRRKMKK